MRRFFDKTLKLTLIIGTPLLLAAWVCYFYPWLECMENESFFCFLPAWMQSFFAEPGGFSRLLSRFFVQFFCNRAFMVAVLAFLAMFLFLAARGFARALVPGESRSAWWRLLPGLVVFVPFWCFAYRDLYHFCLAVAYWLNMMAVWASLPLVERDPVPAPGKGKTFVWRLSLFFVACVLLFYLTGPVSLLYVSLTGILVPWSEFFRSAAVRANPFPALGFSLTGIASWVLTAWLFSIVFVYPVRTMFGLDLWQGRDKDLSLHRVFSRSEKMADREQWRALVDMASTYFDANPNPVDGADREHYVIREMLAVNLKEALLESGLLNRRFFSYGDIHEMNMMLPGNSIAGEYNFPNMRFAWHLGLFVPMRIYTNNILNVNGLQNATLKMVIPNALFLKRYDLAANYLYYLRYTLFYTGLAREWQESFFAEQRRINNQRMQEEPGTALDGWVLQMYTPRSGRNVLEYYTFLKLLYKELDSLPSLARHYRRCGYKILPDYVQEGLLILQDYEPDRDTALRRYAGYDYSPAILAGFRRARQDQKLHRMGGLTVDDIRKTQGSTYFFHYYFRRFLYR